MGWGEGIDELRFMIYELTVRFFTENCWTADYNSKMIFLKKKLM